MYKKIGMFIFFMLFMAFNLLGCGLYIQSEEHRKIDSEEGRKELPKEAYDMAHVEAQKRKELFDSYKLDDGLKSLKDLNIVKEASIENNKIKVRFFIKNIDNKSNAKKSMEKIIWENALFLYYTIYDTFPEIEEIYLSADYYFIDHYGQPFNEELFIAQTNRNQLKIINRDYFQPEMLSGIVDFYMAKYVTEKENKTEKQVKD